MNATESAAWDRRCEEMVDELNAPRVEPAPVDARDDATTWDEAIDREMARLGLREPA
jgi:hypothetical protein